MHADHACPERTGMQLGQSATRRKRVVRIRDQIRLPDQVSLESRRLPEPQIPRIRSACDADFAVTAVSPTSPFIKRFNYLSAQGGKILIEVLTGRQ